MSRKDKLIEWFLKIPTDFHYSGVVRLVSYSGFEEIKKGNTAGLELSL